MTEESLSAVGGDTCDSEENNTFANEKKELRAKISALKHSVNKTDKKKKKEVAAQIEALTAELAALTELAAKDKAPGTTAEPASLLTNSMENSLAEGLNGDADEVAFLGEAPTRMSKAQKRRDKKTAKTKQRDQEIAEEERHYGKTARGKEFEYLSTALSERGLQIKEIPADGDCLYNAVLHQLQRHNLMTLSLQGIRKQTADYMRRHADDFLPFLTTSEDSDAEMMSAEQFARHCDKIEKQAVWGGQSEIKAMASALNVPIEVVQAQGSAVLIGSEFLDKCPSLVIAYHRHAYRLGEHYNSTEPLSASSNDHF